MHGAEVVQRAERHSPFAGRGVSEMKPTTLIAVCALSRSAWATASMCAPRADEHRAPLVAGRAEDHAR